MKRTRIKPAPDLPKPDLYLNYWLPDMEPGKYVGLNKPFNYEDSINHAWLYSMIKTCPEAIFFFTTHTTNVEA